MGSINKKASQPYGSPDWPHWSSGLSLFGDPIKKQPSATRHIRDSLRETNAAINRIENTEREFRALMRKIDMAGQPVYKVFLRWLYDEIAVLLIRTGITFLLMVAHFVAIVLGIALVFLIIAFLIEY